MSSLKTLATYALDKNVLLKIVRGSVVDFCHPRGAIVNAANEGCLGGGGVDGAITSAGGPNLAEDRLKLPILLKPDTDQDQDKDDDQSDHSNSDTSEMRCLTGGAKLTGPGDYGQLQVPYVIHAVGPKYFSFEGFTAPDRLLKEAYTNSLDYSRTTAAASNKAENVPTTTTATATTTTTTNDNDPLLLLLPIEEIAFSLLSAGIFRGDREMVEVLRIGVSSIQKWVEESEDCGKLRAVTMCAFSAEEARMLMDACEAEQFMLLKTEAEAEAETETETETEPEHKRGSEEVENASEQGAKKKIEVEAQTEAIEDSDEELPWDEQADVLSQALKTKETPNE